MTQQMSTHSRQERDVISMQSKVVMRCVCQIGQWLSFSRIRACRQTVACVRVWVCVFTCVARGCVSRRLLKFSSGRELLFSLKEIGFQQVPSSGQLRTVPKIFLNKFWELQCQIGEMVDIYIGENLFVVVVVRVRQEKNEFFSFLENYRYESFPILHL